MVFLIMGSVLPGYMFRYQYCLVGGLEAIVFGSIRWCVWSFRPSSPLRLPHLKCLLLFIDTCLGFLSECVWEFGVEGFVGTVAEGNIDMKLLSQAKCTNFYTSKHGW